MGVDTVHPEYEKMLDEWKLVAACASGSREVKKLGTKILPAPGEKDGVYDKNRYKAYLKRAIYTNVTGRTQQGLTGAAFRLSPEIDLPAGLEYLEDDADGSGQSIEQLSKDVFSSLLKSGREILLTEYPEVEQGLTAEDIEILNPQATIKRYCATELINWRLETIAGQSVLTLAVLQETYNDSADEFQHDEKIQYRVLRLDRTGYSQQVYRDGNPFNEQVYPTKSDGTTFDRMPVFIVGAQNNDASVDEVPLADIAYVNVGHFRNSADLEENSFVHGQMTLGITTNLDSDSWRQMNPNGIVVGSMAGHYLGENGGFHTAQASENQIADKLQERKEGQMLALGAKLVEQRNPNETAAAAKIDATGENSVLSDLVTNVEEGIQRSIEFCGMFMGVDVDGSEAFMMNRQFFDDSIDPQMLMAAIQGYDRGVIAKSDLQSDYRKAGLVDQDRTNEDIDNETGQVSPLE